MLLHLVRHAHAVAENEHPARPLSLRGRGEVARLARLLTAAGVFQPTQVWHSPLRRSGETAAELLARLRLEPVLVETPGLLPEDDPEALAGRLETYPKDRGDLALVGHEPHLSRLASLLVRGRSSPTLFVLKKAAVLTLELTESKHKKTGWARWRVCWLVPPELLPPLPTSATPAEGGAGDVAAD